MTGPARFLRIALRAALAVALAVAVAGVAPVTALAGWRPTTAIKTSLAYNNGIAFDQARSDFFFDGVSSTTNSGLYRTNSALRQTASNNAVIPPTREGYNHAGDLTFDQQRRRILLPLECYYPSQGGNTCGLGAIAAADPTTLRLLYYVNLDATQIKKAMWAEISLDGRWIWTSSGTHLLAYRAADINRATGERQRADTTGGIIGIDLGAVLPTSSVTGATFYEDARTRGPRLLLALNRGSYDEIISYAIGSGTGPPKLLTRTATKEIAVQRSSTDNESEGLAATGPGTGVSPLDGTLRWQMLPVIIRSSFYSRILGYQPLPPPPRDGAHVQPGQRLKQALEHGLKLTVVCNHRCTSIAAATIAPTLARKLGLIPAYFTARSYTVGAGSIGADSGSRTLTITFRGGARRALLCLRAAPLAITVRSTDTYTRHPSTYTLSTTLRR